jgi:hypothetical protein
MAIDSLIDGTLLYESNKDDGQANAGSAEGSPEEWDIDGTFLALDK